MPEDSLLMIADSEHDADMLYAAGFFAPDPFIYARVAGRGHLFLSDLELARARGIEHGCRVHSLRKAFDTLILTGEKNPSLALVAREFLRQHDIKKVRVPSGFPHGIATQLKRLKLKVKPKAGEFFEQRAFKTVAEVKRINAALMMAEVGLAEGINFLKHCGISKKGMITHRDVIVTSERLRAVIDVAVVQAGGLASQTIAAGGTQACDPHERGHGPLKANEPIVLDVFPRSQKTGYFGDMTRTVVKGRASEAVRKMYHTVARAQEVATTRLKPGAPAAGVHRAVEDVFAAEGYRTGRVNGKASGFFHSAGHGLGLELHEPPLISAGSSDQLQIGHVVTLEPALYYSQIGAVRLEDVFLITSKGSRCLSKFEQVLEV